MNSLPQYVATCTPGSLDWNATAVEGDVIAGVEALKPQDGLPLRIYGGATLTQTLLWYGLMDELRLLDSPVVLGRGKRLLSGRDRLSEPLESKPSGQGVILLTYGPGNH